MGLLLLRVASRAEAWIETSHSRSQRDRFVVASRAEAWIETIYEWGKSK